MTAFALSPLLVPCVDIQQGRAVRLFEGDPLRETVYFGSPLQAAQHWAALGAPLLHLVDLDAATGRGDNKRLIAQMMQQLSLNVEVGGGIRDRHSAEALLGAGASRVVLGTAAITRPELVSELISAHGAAAVVVSVDARGLEATTHGWAQGSGVPVAELTARLRQQGLETLIFTDVSRDGTLRGLDAELMAQVRELWPGTLLVGGGVRDVADVTLLAQLGIEGAIVGRAIYEGTLPYPLPS